MTRIKNLPTSKKILHVNYNKILIHEMLKDKLKEAGYSHCKISTTPSGMTKINIHVSRPGVVIGRKGKAIQELTEELKMIFEKPEICDIIETENPLLSPTIQCNRLKSHIEYGMSFRKATTYIMDNIMSANALGVQIIISGKIHGDRSRLEKFSRGILPRSGYYAECIVEESTTHINTSSGLIGIKIRIAKKNRVPPEFELNNIKENNDTEIVITDDNNDENESNIIKQEEKSLIINAL